VAWLRGNLDEATLVLIGGVLLLAYFGLLLFVVQPPADAAVRRLKELHHEVWVQYGFGARGYVRGHAWKIFIREKAYEELADPELARLCLRYSRLGDAITWGYILLVVLGAVAFRLL